MIHRTTLAAIPLVSLVVLGAGLGWWGYDQNRQRQALVQVAANHYASAFHGLISDVNNLHEETDKALVASDAPAFQMRLRQMWRLSYAAQGDVSRLPAGSMPTTHIQAFLMRIADTTNQWLETNANPKSPAINKPLLQISANCQSVSDRLSALQAQAFTNNLSTLAASQGVQPLKQDNQMIDGVKRVDGIAQTYAESALPTLQLGRQTGSNGQLNHESAVTARQAISILGEFTNIAKTQPWLAQETKHASFLASYVVHGNTNAGRLFGLVSKPGGHVLSFHIDHVPTQTTLDFSTASERVIQWADAHGLPKATIVESRQADSVAYFILAPTRRSVPVLSQSVNLSMALDSGQVIGYNAVRLYQNPLTTIPPRRKFTTAQLQHRLNPTLNVKMSVNALALDEHHQYQPISVFYGLAHDRTFRVYMNANTGREMDVERLT